MIGDAAFRGGYVPEKDALGTLFLGAVENGELCFDIEGSCDWIPHKHSPIAHKGVKECAERSILMNDDGNYDRRGG